MIAGSLVTLCIGILLATPDFVEKWAMHWKEIKMAGFKEVDGQSHDVTHLKDVIYQFTIPATSSHPETSFETLVQYSSHCVSWGPKMGEDIDFNTHGYDRRIVDEKGIHRCFCDKRYALSHNLPRIMLSLPDRTCFFTGRDNWLTIEIVMPDGQRKEYEVFFNVTRQSTNMLRVYVESAYIRDSEYEGLKPNKAGRRDKVGGKTLLSKKLRKEPIRQPPRR